MNVADQMKTIENLKGAALREKFREVVGTEPRSKDRPYLLRRIAQALEGNAAKATPAPAAKKARPKTEEKKERDPRLPAPGTILEREHDGKTIRVKVLENGFEFRGKTYGSLSTIAREATGTTWNGLLFFHLIPYAKRTKKAA